MYMCVIILLFCSGVRASESVANRAISTYCTEHKIESDIEESYKRLQEHYRSYPFEEGQEVIKCLKKPLTECSNKCSSVQEYVDSSDISLVEECWRFNKSIMQTRIGLDGVLDDILKKVTQGLNKCEAFRLRQRATQRLFENRLCCDDRKKALGYWDASADVVRRVNSELHFQKDCLWGLAKHVLQTLSDHAYDKEMRDPDMLHTLIDHEIAYRRATNQEWGFIHKTAPRAREAQLHWYYEKYVIRFSWLQEAIEEPFLPCSVVGLVAEYIDFDVRMSMLFSFSRYFKYDKIVKKLSDNQFGWHASEFHNFRCKIGKWCVEEIEKWRAFEVLKDKSKTGKVYDLRKYFLMLCQAVLPKSPQ